jgi:tellurite resistance-related uncharacterized protein
VLEARSLPDDVSLARTTPEMTPETVPGGLLRSHRTAPSVWGRLRVLHGAVTFVDEGSGEARRVAEGEVQVIEPETPHHVEPEPGASFVVDFYR